MPRDDFPSTTALYAFTGLLGDHQERYACNDRNELIGATTFDGVDLEDPGSEVVARRRGYAYDPIGNRLTSAEGDGDDATYTADHHNKYTQVAWPSAAETFTYDADGNMTGDAENNYYWDNENRLQWVWPKSPVEGSLAWRYRYDYLNRRVQKFAFPWNPDANGGQGGWNWMYQTPVVADVRYVYDG